MKVALLTLGCKVNQSELIDIETSLRGRGHINIVGLDGAPEICVINTCSVTAKSDYQSRQLIRRAAATGARVIVTGCYSELNPLAVKDMKGVSHVVSNNEKDSIINMITDEISSCTLDNQAALPRGARRSRYFLKIQDGCDYSCSYCIVWKARGRARSVRPDEVVRRVRRAVECGYKEVVLTGIHLGLYGREFDDSNLIRGAGAPCLSWLLEKILAETDVPRLRLSSLEINEVDGRLLDLLKGGRLARHLHLPLQSGDDRILKLMKRHYDSAGFIGKVNKMVKEIPSLGLGTDVIVGFPGEGEPEFKNTLSVLRELPFTYMHVFAYSPRPGTEAAHLSAAVESPIKKRRSGILRALAAEKKRSFIERLKGETLGVLIERGGEAGDCAGAGKGVCFGYRGVADNYVKVFIPAEYTRFSGGIADGSLVNAEIVGQKEGMAIGKPVILS
ncbi:MAG: MiaB/RimO family radical SAM methylthiotransferase [Nitrospiraceae bacterium]|nr:MiaB/RimO family radical SAM methylthiotransferase [Nitrospiraceae bacterium]